MIERKSGLVVNIASVSGICATASFARAYCATKAAVNLLSVSMRIELAPFGIAVVTVQPGAIKSKFGEAASTASNFGKILSMRRWPDTFRSGPHLHEESNKGGRIFPGNLLIHFFSKRFPK